MPFCIFYKDTLIFFFLCWDFFFVQWRNIFCRLALQPRGVRALKTIWADCNLDSKLQCVILDFLLGSLVSGFVGHQCYKQIPNRFFAYIAHTSFLLYVFFQVFFRYKPKSLHLGNLKCRNLNKAYGKLPGSMAFLTPPRIAHVWAWKVTALVVSYVTTVSLFHKYCWFF